MFVLSGDKSGYGDQVPSLGASPGTDPGVVAAANGPIGSSKRMSLLDDGCGGKSADRACQSPLLASTAEEADEKLRLEGLRGTWKAMLDVVPQDGDASYLVPALFLNRVLEAKDVSSIPELVSVAGKLDCSSIVDQNGALPEHGDVDALTQILPELFHQLVSVFGLRGNPVIRNIAIHDDGTAVLERNPPLFVVHSLTESSHQSKYQNSLCGTNQQYLCSFSLSQSKLFHHLVDAIKTCMFKSKNIEIRVWFVNSTNAEELPRAIPVSMFINDIDEKRLIGPMIMDQTLISQGITSSRYHVVAECLNRATLKFPVDLAIMHCEPSSLDAALVLKSGGNLGLTNLGNTCYMNSALQCLVHLPEVNSYFFFDLFKRELNKTNPLGNKGEVALAFSSLLHNLFGMNNASSSHVTPREFKYTIGRYSSMFHGYQQQDSQEFLSWLLDALHEDLNRIYDKPYLEKPELRDEDVGNHAAILALANTCWAQHKQRNDSIIVDLFTGLYQSTLVCPDCSKQSITFDPFNDLTLPLPVSKKWYHTFTIVDLSNDTERDPILKLEVELTKASNFEDLVAHLSEFLRVPVEQLFLFEVFRHFFYKDFQNNSAAHRFLPVSELIGEDDIIIVYIIPHDASKDLIVPVVNVVRDEDKSYNMSEPFGIPLFVVLDETSETSSFGTIRRKVEQTVKLLSRLNLESRFEEMKNISKKEFYSRADFPLLAPLMAQEDILMVDVNHSSQKVEENGYDSDVSLADPNISASFGFEMRVHEERPRPSVLLRYDQNRNNQNSRILNCLRIPRGRPQFANLPLLAEKLSEKKRNYYHYVEYAEQRRHKEMRNRPKSPSVSLNEHMDQLYSESPPSSETERHSYVMVDKETCNSEKGGGFEETKEPDSETVEEIIDDEDIDSDTNYDHVSSLFTSVDSFGGPPKLSIENESIATEAPESMEQEATGISKDRPVLVSGASTLVVEWDPMIYAQFFTELQHQAWMQPTPIPNPRLDENKRLLKKQQNSKISLYDCLKNFSTPEVLGEQDLWYCPRCKDHKRATKTIQLWSTGDLLTIHLKRFQSARHFSDKIDMVVDFPIEGLDVSNFVSSGEGTLYDLVAVDEHYGGLGGGHYTASAKNFRDGKWYKFNDSRVTSILDPKDCVTSAAYLLFYKKRTSASFSGGDGVETLLKSGQSEFETKMDGLRSRRDQIAREIESFNQQLQMAEEIQQTRDEEDISSEASHDKEIDEKENGESGNEEEEDLYADSDLNQGSLIPSTNSLTSNKKLRSPVAEQLMKFEFENQRKQRLISRGSGLSRSVNINMGYSSSASNLASPEEGSTDEDTT